MTAIAVGTGSSGVVAGYESVAAGAFTLELENSIARGARICVPLGSNGGPGNIAVTHSNFETVVPVNGGQVIDGGGNQSAAPLFVDAEGGDYREASGSPTIDAGIAGQLGPLDLTGNSRTLGSAPDIGAYEFVPAPQPPVAAAGALESLKLSKARFRAAKGGEAILSAARKKGKHRRSPVGTTVTYSLSAAGTVSFSVERRVVGRKVGKRCVKKTGANRAKRRCATFKPVRGSFSQAGAAGAGHFRFSGRLGGRALKPGAYRLLGEAGGASKTVSFTILR